MSYNKLVFGGLALGCMAAAAGGGYLAARQAPEGAATTMSAATTSAATTSAPATADANADAAKTPGQPVSESEGVIAPDAPLPAAPALEAPARAAVPAAAPRRESTTRPTRTVPTPQRRAEPAAPPSRPARDESRRAEADPPASTPSTGGMWEARPTVAPERAAVMEVAPEPAAPAAPEFVDVVIPTDAVLGLQIERTVTSENARVEDRVEARLTRDVRVGEKVAIPAGSIVQGSVMEVERGGKIKERARLGIRFHTVVMADGTRLNIRTDSVVREGAAVAGESAAKIGGAAVGGAILGAILGGGKGAIIGGATGAAGGTAATMAGQRNPAVLPAGTTVSVRVQQPVTVTVEK